MLKGHGVLTVPCVRKTGSVTPEVPDDKDPVKPGGIQKPGTSDGDKRPGGSVSPITKPGNTGNTTITNINNNTGGTANGGTKTVTKTTTLSRPSGSILPSAPSGENDSSLTADNTKEMPEMVTAPDYKISTSLADKTEEGGTNMNPITAAETACNCQCFTMVILFLAFVMIVLFALWLVITDRRRKEDREREERRLNEKAETANKM